MEREENINQTEGADMTTLKIEVVVNEDIIDPVIKRRAMMRDLQAVLNNLKGDPFLNSFEGVAERTTDQTDIRVTISNS